LILQEIKNIDSSLKKLKEFGIVVGGILIIISSILFYNDNEFQIWLFAGLYLILIGLILPKLHFFPHKIWMILAVLLGIVMNKIILFVMYFLIVTPIGLIGKIFGKEFLDSKLENGKKSYWIGKQEQSDPTKQF
jgi:hypothetical protein